jgi:hypothetical protein
MIFDMMDYKSMVIPMDTNMKNLSVCTSYSDLVDPTMCRQLIGSFMYLVKTRPPIFFIESILSQFMVDLRHYHRIATKHVLRYLHGTIVYDLRYLLGCEVRV